MLDLLIQQRAANLRRGYRDMVLNTSAATLLAYFPMHDCVPGGTCTDVTANAYNGTYGSAVSRIGDGIDGLSACRMIGAANSWVELYSAGLGAAWGINAGTIMLWARFYDALSWMTSYATLAMYRTDANNVGFIRKSNATTIQQFAYSWYGGGTVKYADINSPRSRELGNMGWICYAQTWTGGGNMLSYFDGTLQNTQTGVGTWVGQPSVIRAGATETPGNYAMADISHVAVWSSVLTAAQILTLSR